MSKRSRIGRPQHDFWLRGNFEQITIKSRPAALCQFCLRSLQNTSKFRLIQHRRTCRGTSNVLVYDSDAYIKNDTDVSDTILENEDASDLSNTEKIKKLSQISLKSEDLCTDGNLLPDEQPSSSTSCSKDVKKKKENKHKEKADIDKALSMFFFGCDIPLSVVESSTFKNLIKTLRPSYKPPSRKALSTMLLDKTLDLLKDDEEPNK